MFKLTLILSFVSLFLALENSGTDKGTTIGNEIESRSLFGLFGSANPKFLLYTTKNPNQAQQLNEQNQKSNKATNFNSKHQTKFIIHGYMDNIKLTNWMQTLKDQLLKKGDFNVIIVDWSSGSSVSIYAQAAVNARVVGGAVDNLIRSLQVIYLEKY